MSGYWKPESELLQSLDKAVPEILASQKENGQFGTEPWISTDQNVLLALAAAWHLPESAHNSSGEVLEAIVRGGIALVDAQDDDGKVTFRKKDHSTWGQIHMPWSFSRWVRAYQLVRAQLDTKDRDRWDAGLLLAYTGISDTALGHVHNIPTHHAMGLYCAGVVFDRGDWREQARAFMPTVCKAQSPHGWWPEQGGPVVAYNFIYAEALGVYHAMSEDKSVLDALERASNYHANFTYPDGSAVETIDGRNPYHTGVHLGNPGFTFSEIGRGYLQQQHGLYMKRCEPFPADYAAHLLLYGDEGPTEPTSAGLDRHVYRMGSEALTVRRKPWSICLSATTGEIPDNRWGQDRQNFVSVYHDEAGLVVGGGNTKLQPLWSSFTVGDTTLLRHISGDEDPDFSPREGLDHVPDSASVRDDEDAPAVSLKVGGESCRITLIPESDTRSVLVYEATNDSGLPVEGHVTLLPTVDEALTFGTAEMRTLGKEPFEISGVGSVSQDGWEMSVPDAAKVIWPAMAHNPYTKDGSAELDSARLVIALPFTESLARFELVLEVRTDL